VKLLAIDTSSNACSVALQVAEDIRELHVVEPRAHTRILLPMVSELLAERGVELRDLDAVVLGNGPGSFIGMRIGASVAQGLCFGSGIPLVPVSSLAAIAMEVFSNYDHDHVTVAQDARMNEIYLASFRKGADAVPELVGEEMIVAVGKLEIADTPYAAAGAAWKHYPELLEANLENISALLPINVPRAKHLLPPGILAVRSGQAIAPEALTPAYLRMKVADKPAPVS
jgi:tRNA threonylcarbamoyladenosine biosynthesis protein TsaB